MLYLWSFLPKCYHAGSSETSYITVWPLCIFNLKNILIAGCCLIGLWCFLITSCYSKIPSSPWLFLHQSKSPAAAGRERVAIKKKPREEKRAALVPKRRSQARHVQFFIFFGANGFRSICLVSVIWCLGCLGLAYDLFVGKTRFFNLLRCQNIDIILSAFVVFTTRSPSELLLNAPWSKNRRRPLEGSSDILYQDDKLLSCRPWQARMKDALRRYERWNKQ